MIVIWLDKPGIVETVYEQIDNELIELLLAKPTVQIKRQIDIIFLCYYNNL